jgi:hypothetical protein
MKLIARPKRSRKENLAPSSLSKAAILVQAEDQSLQIEAGMMHFLLG